MTQHATPFGGGGFPGAEPLADFLELLPTPVSYCRMLYRDGSAYDFECVYANPAFEQKRGFGPVVGRRASEVIPGFRESHPAIFALYERVAAGGATERFQMYMGELQRWVTVQAYCPKPGHFVAVLLDVDDHAPTSRLRSIFNAMTEGLVVHDREGRITDCNRAAEQILGLSHDEILGRTSADPRWQTLREDLSPLPAEEHPAMVTLRTGQPLRDRIVGVRDPKRGLRWLSVNSQPLGPGEAPDYAVAVFVDITEQRQAEQLLRESKAKLEAALGAMTDAVLIADARGRFVQFNQAFAAFHRFESIDDCWRAAGQFTSLFEVLELTGDPVPAHDWLPMRALRGEAGVSVERRLRRRDTGESWVASYSFGPIRDDDGKAIGLVLTGRDMTDARRTQDALNRSHQDLRSLVAQMHLVEEQERRRIARELHDELQQALAAARLDIASVRRALGSGAAGGEALAEGAAVSIDAAIDATRRMVNDLRPAVLDELGLVTALESMADRVGPRTGSRIELAVLGRKDADRELPADVNTCLYRVAQEALNNIGKHAGATRVDITLDLSRSGEARLRVVDNGRGVRSEDLRKRGSFGVLGMEERLHALGGTLRVAPLPGGGTVVEAFIGMDG